MLEVKMVSGILMYIVTSIMTYVVIKYLILNALDMANKEDREILESKMTVNTATFIISAVWFVSIPIIIINTFREMYRY